MGHIYTGTRREAGAGEGNPARDAGQVIAGATLEGGIAGGGSRKALRRPMAEVKLGALGVGLLALYVTGKKGGRGA